MRKIIPVAVASSVVVCLAACAGSHSSAASQPVLACHTVFADGHTASQDIQRVVSDQHRQDQSQSENWVHVVDTSDSLAGRLTSQGEDLQSLVNNLAKFRRVTGFASDVNRFQSAATTFLTDQDDGLVPGWAREYSALKADIYALGKDCQAST